MKKIIVLMVLWVSIVYASLYNKIQNKLDSAIYYDSKHRWLLGTYIGNLTILDATELSKNKIKIKGTFKTKTEIGTVLTKHYIAYMKVVLDDVVITSCCWETAFGTNWCI